MERGRGRSRGRGNSQKRSRGRSRGGFNCGPPHGPQNDYMGGPPHGHRDGPQNDYMGGPPHGPQNYYMGGPPRGHQDGPPRGHRDGPPRDFMGGPPHGPPHDFMGGPPHGPRDGPPHDFMAGPPYGHRDGPPHEYMGGPPHGPRHDFMGGPPHGPRDGPPHDFMAGPPYGHQDGPPHEYMGGPPHGPRHGHRGGLQSGHWDGPAQEHMGGHVQGYMGGPQKGNNGHTSDLYDKYRDTGMGLLSTPNIDLHSVAIGMQRFSQDVRQQRSLNDRAKTEDPPDDISISSEKSRRRQRRKKTNPRPSDVEKPKPSGEATELASHEAEANDTNSVTSERSSVSDFPGQSKSNRIKNLLDDDVGDEDEDDDNHEDSQKDELDALISSVDELCDNQNRQRSLTEHSRGRGRQFHNDRGYYRGRGRGYSRETPGSRGRPERNASQNSRTHNDHIEATEDPAKHDSDDNVSVISEMSSMSDRSGPRGRGRGWNRGRDARGRGYERGNRSRGRGYERGNRSRGRGYERGNRSGGRGYERGKKSRGMGGRSSQSSADILEMLAKVDVSHAPVELITFSDESEGDFKDSNEEEDAVLEDRSNSRGGTGSSRRGRGGRRGHLTNLLRGSQSRGHRGRGSAGRRGRGYTANHKNDQRQRFSREDDEVSLSEGESDDKSMAGSRASSSYFGQESSKIRSSSLGSDADTGLQDRARDKAMRMGYTNEWVRGRGKAIRLSTRGKNRGTRGAKFRGRGEGNTRGTGFRGFQTLTNPNTFDSTEDVDNLLDRLKNMSSASNELEEKSEVPSSFEGLHVFNDSETSQTSPDNFSVKVASTEVPIVLDSETPVIQQLTRAMTSTGNLSLMDVPFVLSKRTPVIKQTDRGMMSSESSPLMEVPIVKSKQKPEVMSELPSCKPIVKTNFPYSNAPLEVDDARIPKQIETYPSPVKQLNEEENRSPIPKRYPPISDGQNICEKHIWEKCTNEDVCPCYHGYTVPYQWQYMYQGQWKDFPETSNEMSDMLFSRLHSKASVRLNWPLPIEVDYTEMTAKLDGYWTVQIRRLSTPSYASGENQLGRLTFWRWYWNFSNDSVDLKPYDQPNLQYTLEKKYLNGQKEYFYTLGKFEYKMTFAEDGMFQTNLKTGMKRTVIRRPVFVSLDDVKHKNCIPVFDLLQDCPSSVQSIPKHWAALDIFQSHEHVPLNPESKCYTEARAKFYETMKESDYSITSIVRVQNPARWNTHCSHRQAMEHTARREGFTQDIEERMLFHGTTPEVVPGICVNGFDFRVSGKNGTVYGKGAYFATRAAYSTNYAGPNKKKCMFLARVLVGQYTRGNSELTRPPVRKGDVLYDSCVDNTGNPTIFICFHQDQAYPEFLIHYEDKRSISTERAPTVSTSTIRQTPRGLGTSYGQITGTAYGQTTGTPQARTSGTAYGQTTGTAYGQTTGTAYGQTTGTSQARTTGTAYGQTTGTAYGQTTGTAYGQTTGTSYGQATGTAYGQATVSPSSPTRPATSRTTGGHYGQATTTPTRNQVQTSSPAPQPKKEGPCSIM